MATDPDCDRVGVAVRTTSGEYAMLTGNQIGGMLTNYIIEARKAERTAEREAKKAAKATKAAKVADTDEVEF